MPTLTLKISRPQNAVVVATALPYKAVAQALSRLTALHLRKRPEVTAVMIDELPAGQWHIGGEPVQSPTVYLEISITQGTNTSAHEAAFTELQQQLGNGAPLAPASYVIVREVPATDWGYGGQTQESRRQAMA
jgi:4-oxalocrotonate tautomerase